MIDVPTLLKQLAAERPIFHSEADFQHALAWRIHLAVPDAQVRLEYRLHLAETIYLDLWVRTADGGMALELKYPTRKLQCGVSDEEFALKDQSAQDVRRYDFVKDIARLEQVVAATPQMCGCAVLLTNDSAYWTGSLSKATVDAAFRLHEGATLTGTLSWASHAGTGTTMGRERALRLNGAYPLTWQDYAVIAGASPYNRFRYLLVPVGATNRHDRSDVANPRVTVQANMADHGASPMPESDGVDRHGGRGQERVKMAGALHRQMDTHADQIMHAVTALVERGQRTFTQAELRDHVGVDRERWARGFSAIFQAMRADHPGGAPPITARYRGIFRQVEHGRHMLTPYGQECLNDYKPP